MKTILIKNYQCEYCNKIFDLKQKCLDHKFMKHKCPNCIHSYYVYGCEFNCELENEGKKCRFKEKEN